jgi:hypothetical protein
VSGANFGYSAGNIKKRGFEAACGVWHIYFSILVHRGGIQQKRRPKAALSNGAGNNRKEEMNL